MSVVVEMTGDEAKLWKSLQKIVQQTGKVEKAGEKAGKKYKKAGKESDKAFGGAALTKLTAYGAGLVGVSSTVGMITKGYEAQVAAAKELATESRKASNELVAFAALQEGGTKAQRVHQATALAAQFGITDRGEAFNTVQALQSALGGDFEAGMKAAETTFRATQLGISLPRAREVAALGIAQGQGGPEALRRTYVAGQESSRDPEIIASGARGLGFFTDPVTGFAAAGQLAGGVGESELVTYVQAAGEALSATSNLDKVFKKLGVTAGTEIEKLEALKEAGIITIEELAVAGLGEKRQRRALSILIPNVENVKRMRQAIEEKAIPGIFPSQRHAVETEIPQTRLARESRMLEARFKDAGAFGPHADAASAKENARQVRGVALRELGHETIFGMDVIDEEGRSGPFDAFLYMLKYGPATSSTGILELNVKLEEVRRWLEGIGENMQRAADAMGKDSTEPEETLAKHRSGEAVSP